MRLHALKKAAEKETRKSKQDKQDESAELALKESTEIDPYNGSLGAPRGTVAEHKALPALGDAAASNSKDGDHLGGGKTASDLTAMIRDS